MNPTQFIYQHEGNPLLPCNPGEFELQIGEQVTLTIEPKNPLWPSTILATIVGLNPTRSGRDYTIEFDQDLLNGGPLFEGCDLLGVEPYCCCDALDARVSELESRPGGSVVVAPLYATHAEAEADGDLAAGIPYQLENDRAVYMKK